jgi:ATP-binding cassette, subfamily C, bacterial
MRQLLTIFFRTPHANAWTVLVALAFAALAEGLGLATFLPVMSIVLGTGETASPAYTLVSSVMASLGLAMTLANLLLVMVAAISAKAALTLLAMYHVGSAVARVSTGLRMRLLVDLMRARWSYFVAQPVGRVANAVSGEATK